MVDLPIAVGAIIRNGIVFDFKNWDTHTMNEDDVQATVARLFSLLSERGIDYVLISSMALLQCVAGRNTQDIDLIIALPALEAVPEIQLTQRDEYFLTRREKAPRRMGKVNNDTRPLH